MKAAHITVSGSTFLLTSFEKTLTLLDASPGSKQLMQQPLGEEFLIIPMNSPGLFATIGYDKKFRIWSIEGSSLLLQYCCSFAKKLTHGAALTLDSKELCYFADKFGDVYVLNTQAAVSSHELEGKMIRQDFAGPSKEEEAVCRFIMGHQEVISIVEVGRKFLVTIDKAKKIKVSKVPRYFEIHGIYFGHHEEIVFAKLLDDSTLMTVDKGRNVIVWDLSKCEDAILFQEKAGTGGIGAINTVHSILGIVDKSTELYEVDKSSRKLTKIKEIPLPETFKCMELLGDKQLVMIGVDEKTKAIQAIPV